MPKEYRLRSEINSWSSSSATCHAGLVGDVGRSSRSKPGMELVMVGMIADRLNKQNGTLPDLERHHFVRITWLTGGESPRIVAPMFQRLSSPFDEELYAGDGLWSRSELEEMNDRFVAAMEQAFANGGESRTAAAATVKMNGKPRADEIAIELAWRWLRGQMD